MKQHIATPSSAPDGNHVKASDLVEQVRASTRGSHGARDQSARYPLKIVAPRRQQSVKGQFSDLKQLSPQVADPAEGPLLA